MKEIHFYKDLVGISLSKFLRDFYASHNETIRAIKYGVEVIHTTALSALCFSNLLDKGYKIFLHENGKCGELHKGVTELTDNELRKGHNISTIWIGGGFENFFYPKDEQK
jgi:hypothetical protein